METYESFRPITDALKEFLPDTLRERVRARHRAHVFRRALNRLTADPIAAIASSKQVLCDLVYGWNNPDWSAREEYLAACVEHALNSDGPILECGSGLTTLVIGRIAARRRRMVWVLEHDSEWATKVTDWLQTYAIESVRLSVGSLRAGPDFWWYEPPLDKMPEFSLVICDGPPSTTPGGRYGLLPVMSSKLNSRAVILLDDARQHDESSAMRWACEWGTTHQVHGVQKPYIRVVMPGPKRS
jgi:hypothetical protein